ncbi:leucine-rich repeat and WD repeat-containing protein 1 [Vidua macroura]|uniref:leucine-rich repeat and WD repeat-containing protein 1 n=1 Tax=Vidua chalybeata TaxID=81927 RepID=UPI0023A7BF0B|nr:leucine-rich repeat and WD repeat-containing protein 1 [Vidua chalybeata]XP_053816847.1 leucine-rich repeat and WD repeat-containing protein 1 [Vidua chalybeata]XP_053816848.1 leucine-rich repeat and WD repeat-containing protein 1 [Vidua chalybeata]XP_053851674.1 leucine-rich repeat and WD repeat-containing protein 1 [Vidua macroura]XP_053851675.1 leucine-rich repeat and WD repeat-containing protein 1 [Vidua macroura]XP_053851676.1 leucine-rich repeat and WD repeat-containing protein 1 [Vid
MSKITTELLLERAVPRSTRLRKIETLNLSKLQLKTGDLDPRLFSRLRHLQKLDLSDNLLDKFPSSLTLPDLRVLNCNNNKLEDVTALKQFPLLEELTYENNVYLTLNDDYKVMFLLQNLRLLNGKDITKLANHVRCVNSRKLTSKVTAHWKKFFSDQLPEKYTAEQVKSIKKKFLKSVQTNVVYGPSSLSEFTRWRVKMIAEEFLAHSLGLELNSDTEPEEKTDENEEESTESPREAAEDVAQVTVTPSKRKRNHSKSSPGNKRSKTQANTEEEAAVNPRKSSHVEDDPAPDKPRTSNQPAKDATPEQGAEGTQKNGEQFPKGQSNRRSSQMTGEQKSQEQDSSVVTLTPVKNSKRKEDVSAEPLHFLQCHSKGNSREDFKTQLWSCVFEPVLDSGARKDPIVSSSRTVATCGGESVCLIDCETGTVLKKYKVATEEFFSVAWTTLTMVISDSRKKAHNILAAAGRRGIVKLIHVAADFCYGEIKAHKKPIATVCFSPTQETHLFTASYDKRIALWDIGIPDCDYNFKASQLLVLETASIPLRIALVPTCPEQYLLAGCEDGCFAWNIKLDKGQKSRPFEAIFQFPGQESMTTSHRVDGLAFLNDDVVVSKSSKPGCIYLWSWSKSFDAKGKGCQRTMSAVILAELEWSTTDMSYLTLSTCPAKEYVFCGDEKGSVWMYNLSNYTTAWGSPKGKRSERRISPTQILKWPELRVNGEQPPEILVNNVVADPAFTYLVVLTSVNITAIWKKS